MKIDEKIDELARELVYQLTGTKVVDTQDPDYQIAIYYLNKALSITAVVQAKPEKFKCLARNPNPNSEWNYECDKQCKKCAKL